MSTTLNPLNSSKLEQLALELKLRHFTAPELQLVYAQKSLKFEAIMAAAEF